MITNVRHVGIVVSNLEASLHFYEKLLGFKIVKEMDESGKYMDNISALKNVRVTTIKMAAPDSNLIELLYFRSPINMRKQHKEFCQSFYGQTFCPMTLFWLHTPRKKRF